MQQNSFEQPDLELMLRGRPAELQPIKVQLLAPVAPAPPPKVSGRAARAFFRHRRLLIGLALSGAILALAIRAIQQPMATATTTLEVREPASAETVVRRVLARRIPDVPVAFIQLSRLPEYASPAKPANLFRRILGLSMDAPSEEEFQNGFHRYLTIRPSAKDRLIDIEFRASDPPKAAAYLDLLSGEIVRDHASLRDENVQLVRDSFSSRLNSAKNDLTRAENDLFNAARNIGLVDGDVIGTDQADRLSKRLDATFARQVNRTERLLQLDTKRREYEAKRSAYDLVTKSMQQAEISALNEGLIRQLAPARVSLPSRTPSLWLTLLLGISGGLMLGIPFCLVREAADRAVRTPSDLQERLGLQALGTIPHAARRKKTFGMIGLAGAGEADLMSGRANPVIAPGMGDSFRNVLASMWIASQNSRRPRVLTLISPAAKEGRSMIAANLAISLAHTRRRVLLIDGDLRRPRLHSMFGAPPTNGLANILEQDKPVEEYAFDELVWKTDIPGLYLLFAGNGNLAIAGMRHVDRLTELLLRFRLEFHAVLIDTPPALAYPEARVLTRLADGAVMVLRSGESSVDTARRLANQMKNDGADILGAILNDYGRN